MSDEAMHLSLVAIMLVLVALFLWAIGADGAGALKGGGVVVLGLAVGLALRRYRAR